MKILDKGEVKLLNQMGGDLAVIAAARVSNGVEYEEASKGYEADQRLINYLVAHRHGTPFEHSTFQFYIKAPLFVRSEWHRHRIASYNEISGRYVEYEPEFYFPDKLRVPAKSNKQGSVEATEEFATEWYADGRVAYTGEVALANWTDVSKASIEAATAQCWAWYQDLIHHKGVAKEMARMVLPSNLYTQFYMTVNARALMNFLSLRAAEDAQWEIRQYAIAMKEMFQEVMPLTYNAWETNNFIAP